MTTTTTAGRAAAKGGTRARAERAALPAVLVDNPVVVRTSALIELGSEKAHELRAAGEKGVKELQARVLTEQKTLRKAARTRVTQVQGALKIVPVKLEEGFDLALGSVGLMRVSVHEKALSSLRASLRKARTARAAKSASKAKKKSA